MAIHKLTGFKLHIDADHASVSDFKLPEIKPVVTRLKNFHVTPAGWVLAWRLWAAALDGEKK